eukprot:666016-Alexandrium_andersonii.AAC.1
MALPSTDGTPWLFKTAKDVKLAGPLLAPIVGSKAFELRSAPQGKSVVAQLIKQQEKVDAKKSKKKQKKGGQASGGAPPARRGVQEDFVGDQLESTEFESGNVVTRQATVLDDHINSINYIGSV